MTNWQEIVDGIEAPREMTPSQWLAAQGPKLGEGTNSLSFGTPLETFLAKYKISTLGPSQVALTLPAGTARIELLEEAQALSIALHASNPEKYRANQAVSPTTLESWKSEPGSTEAVENDLALKIDGNVKGSTNHTRKQQEDKGWNDVTLQDLAVAHTAFYLLTGKGLFEGKVVRAAAGALLFSSYGLVVNIFFDDFRYDDVSASRSLSSPN